MTVVFIDAFFVVLTLKSLALSAYVVCRRLIYIAVRQTRSKTVLVARVSRLTTNARLEFGWCACVFVDNGNRHGESGMECISDGKSHADEDDESITDRWVVEKEENATGGSERTKKNLEPVCVIVDSVSRRVIIRSRSSSTVTRRVHHCHD